jgi:hypothetical protein
MFTKYEVKAYVADRIEDDSESNYPTPMAVQAGAYESFWSTTYDEYIELAKVVKRLREGLGQSIHDIPIEAFLAAKSLYIDIAISHLKKIEENQIINQ